MKKDYFAILGLKPGASDEQIRSAYKRLAKKYHPDFNPGDKRAEEKFKELSQAYAVLSDPEKRRQWERGDVDFESFFQSGGGPGGPGDIFGSFGFGDMADIFGDLFSGQRGGFRASRGADLQYEAAIDFEGAVRGTVLRVPLARTVACESCGGTGRRPGRSLQCLDCGGSGRIRVTETLKVKIPAGVNDGAKVRVPRKGEAGWQGGPPGDLYVHLRVRPHPYFRRQGADILLDLPLTVAEAALGTTVEVPTIGGRVTLKVPPGSSSGRRLRLRGRGVPSPNGAEGDQIVVLQIVTPAKISTKSRKIIEEFDRLNPIDPRSDLGW